MSIRQAWRDLTDGLAQMMEDATVTGRLRAAAVKRTAMPLCELSGDALEKGLLDLITATGAAGLDWDEAARRIVGAPRLVGVDKEHGRGATAGPDPDE